ncbi:putative pentatricopeptide repeat-containing protein At5g52630 isoform X2 [Carica papaya]|uniref:putative pentatricopeptide repeat-containing protein At5g52630 isoform X2 n=1 Tax=Carica papaya TaxID=3649 RepID=UPI000B8D020F|nr:putative pentatricopeptide repeat-containing protein At5g52630 isoform X2 [Carica papaya]
MTTFLFLFPFMASLPSVALSGNLKLDTEPRKQLFTFLAPEKSPGLSYTRNQTITPLDGSIEAAITLDFQEALSIVKDGKKIESSYYVPLFQECIDKNSFSNAQVLHSHIVKTGTHQDFFIMTFLINVYAKCRSMEDAQKIFNNLDRRNVVSWTTLMTGYVQNSQPELAIHVFKEMLEVGSYPTNYTLGAALNASSALNSIGLGKQIHAYIVKYRIDFDTSIGNSLCSFYSTCGSLDSAVKSFQKIREKNIVSWTTVISAFGDNGKAAKGLRIFTEMLSEGIQPNEFTLSTVLSLCCTMLYLSIGSQLHSLSIKRGYESNLRINNSIMYLYLKCGRIDEAQKLFDVMGDVSLVTWNAMIAGHAQMVDLAKDDVSAYHSGTEALSIFLKLNRSAIRPDLYTFSSILTVCGEMVALEQGEQVHAQTLKTGFLSEVVVGTALVNMYNKCGSIGRASKAFLEMSTRTLISWTSMITGLAHHGQTEQALQLFEDMRVAGVRPNQITFVGVLSACSHAGMVNESLGYLKIMQKDYKMKPLMDHYGCLIDMFVRLGRLEEAFEFIKKMGFPPNEFIWSLLLAGCRRQENTELGLYAAEQLLKLKPKDIETYVLLLNMYIFAERWQEVSKVRRIIREEKLGNLKDWGWISIKDKVHSFKSSDRSNLHSSEISTLLEELLEKAKRHGYEQQESFELIEDDDEEKTYSSLVYHSEKLAVTFGLLNTPNAAPIRIIKNLCMCRDCHNFVKVISLLTGRTIIIRDSKRLHRFVNGHCSCGDSAGLL